MASPGDSIGVVASISGSAAVIFGALWRLVRATWAVSTTVRENNEAVKTLTQDMGLLRNEISVRITTSQHSELLARVGAIEQVLYRGAELSPASLPQPPTGQR